MPEFGGKNKVGWSLFNMQALTPSIAFKMSPAIGLDTAPQRCAFRSPKNNPLV